MTSLDHRLRGPDGAPVLVLSNSLGTTQELWERQLPALAEHFRVLTYDHPGHGSSPLPQQPCTVESFAYGLLELLDELGLTGADPARVVDETIGFLLDREPATNIQPELTLAEVVDRYEGFVDELRARLSG